MSLDTERLMDSAMLYRDWLNLRTHLLWCYDHQSFKQGPVYRSTDFANSGAWLVRSGWAEVRYENGLELRAVPGQWLIVKPGKRVQLFARDTHLLSIAFEASWPDGTNWLDQGLPLTINADDCPILEQKAKPMVRLMKKVSPDETQWDVRQVAVHYRELLLLERHLANWFLSLADTLVEHGISLGHNANIDQRVIQAVSLIDSHPLGEPLDQHKLAAAVYLSTAHLSRIFQRDLEITPRQYFENRRLDYASRRLCMSDVRAKDVSICLGFRYLSHFSKWFRNSTGMSPSEFIQDAGLTKHS